MTAAIRRGIFLKTAAPQLLEVLEGSGLDFAVIDAEHAAFDRRDIDLMLLAGRATGLPLYVRVPDHAASGIQSALDLGAAGVVVPHVDTPDMAREVVRAARYLGGTRGYSGGPRAAGYGSRPMAETIAAGDRSQVIVQIEHPDAVRAASAILAVDGVAGLLVGRADLSLAMGHTSQGPEVDAAIEAMMATLQVPDGRIVGFVTGSAEEQARWQARGANWFLVGTDHGLLRQGLRRQLAG